MRYLFFYDDTFILDKGFVLYFCKKFKERGFDKKVKWNVNVRANLVTDEIIKTIKDAGCYEVRNAGFDGPGLAGDRLLARRQRRGRAPTTWVTDDHDTPRSVSRLARTPCSPGRSAGDDGLRCLPGGRPRAGHAPGAGAGPDPAGTAGRGLHLRRPGAAACPTSTTSPWRPCRTRLGASGHTVRGRDGAGPLMPWSPGRTSGSPRSRAKRRCRSRRNWAALSVASQRASGDSMLSLYRRARPAAHEPGPGSRRAAVGVLAGRGSRPDRLRHGRRGGHRARPAELSGPRSTCRTGSSCSPRSRWTRVSCPHLRRLDRRPAFEGIQARLGALVQFVAEVIDPRRSGSRRRPRGDQPSSASTWSEHGGAGCCADSVASKGSANLRITADRAWSAAPCAPPGARLRPGAVVATIGQLHRARPRWPPTLKTRTARGHRSAPGGPPPRPPTPLDRRLVVGTQKSPSRIASCFSAVSVRRTR